MSNLSSELFKFLLATSLTIASTASAQQGGAGGSGLPIGNPKMSKQALVKHPSSTNHDHDHIQTPHKSKVDASAKD